MKIFIATVIMYSVLTAIACAVSRDIRKIREYLFRVECEISEMNFYADIKQSDRSNKEPPKKHYSM